MTKGTRKSLYPAQPVFTAIAVFMTRSKRTDQLGWWGVGGVRNSRNGFVFQLLRAMVYFDNYLFRSGALCRIVKATV